MESTTENKSLRKHFRSYLKEYLNSRFPSSYFISEIIPHLEDWLIPTVIYDFHLGKNRSFSKFLEENPLDLILDKYPSLKERVLIFLDESFQEYALASKVLGNQDIRIMGDIHPGSVTKHSDDKFVVYKNFPNYMPLIDSLSKEVLPSLFNYFPKIEKEEEWFRRSFINVQKDGKDSDIKKYYYNFGYIMPLLLLLRTIDSNQENILIDLPYPKFFDFECIFLADVGEFPYSILSSGLVMNGEQDRSSLTGGIKKVQSLLKPMFFGNDNQPIVKWIVESKGVFDNIPMLNDEYVSPKEYLSDISQGWEDGARDILDKKEEIIDIVKKIDISFRVILKATKVYRYITLRSLYPQVYLQKDKELREYIKEELNSFPNICDINEQKEDLFSYEIDSIMKCQVPVLYSKLNSTEIYSPNGTVVANHKRKPLDVWIEYLEGFNKVFLDKQFEELKRSL